MNVAVLGGGGFIGSSLSRRLVADGHNVTCFDRDFPSFRAAAWSGARTVAVDLRHEWGWDLAGFEWVVHLAADMGGVGYFHAHDYAPAADNARMTLNVLDACERANVGRLFYASSACAYPTEHQDFTGSVPRLREGMLESGTPDQMYGREKLFGLRLCERAPFDARVGILHTVYGPGQEHEGERMKFPAAVATKALRSARTGEPLIVWGAGDQARSYLYVDDAVDRIVTVLSSDRYEGPVNIGAAGWATCIEVAGLCLGLLAVDVPIVCDPTAGPTGVTARDCDNTKWDAVYGQTTTTDLSDGFTAFLDWLRERQRYGPSGEG